MKLLSQLYFSHVEVFVKRYLFYPGKVFFICIFIFIFQISKKLVYLTNIKFCSCFEPSQTVVAVFRL